MATFPILKTGAVAQYPARRTVQYQNQALRFLDGTEQRYRDSAGPLHRWTIQLAELDEGEMAALEAFLIANQGVFATFSFTDPWDGTVYPNCGLASDEMDLTSTGEMTGSTQVVVVEYRA